jgi:hypothetical protein
MLRYAVLPQYDALAGGILGNRLLSDHRNDRKRLISDFLISAEYIAPP